MAAFCHWCQFNEVNGKKRCLADLADAVVDAADKSLMLCDVVTKPDFRETFVRYHNGIQRLYEHTISAKILKTDKNIAPEVYWVFGPAGKGKSRWVHEKEENVYDVSSDDKYKWKQNYAGQEAVIYDNVSPENIEPTRILKEIDRYTTQVSVKGSSMHWRPRRIYFTSVFGLELFAQTAKFSQAAEFTRRITQVVDIVALNSD